MFATRYCCRKSQCAPARDPWRLPAARWGVCCQVWLPPPWQRGQEHRPHLQVLRLILSTNEVWRLILSPHKVWRQIFYSWGFEAELLLMRFGGWSSWGLNADPHEVWRLILSPHEVWRLILCSHEVWRLILMRVDYLIFLVKRNVKYWYYS